MVASTQSLSTYILFRYISDLWKYVPISSTEEALPLEEIHYCISKKYTISAGPRK